MSNSSDRIESAEELLASFRSRDRKNVFVPKTMRFPLSLGHYLAWTEPSGVRVYLVFRKAGWKAPIGVAFRRDQQGSANSPAGMCEWCLDCGPSDRIGLLTATVNSKKRVGVNLCLDLNCIQKLETFAKLTGKDLGKMADKLREEMARFCQEALEISAE